MSFVNIKDINRRDEIIKNFLSLKQQIQTRDRLEKMGEIGREEALSKFFKPVTKGTEQLGKKLTEGTEQLGKKLTEEIGKIAKPDTSAEPYTGELPPPIDENDDPELNEYLKNISKIKTIQAEVTKEGVNFKMAGLPLNVTKNNIEYMGSEYTRTPELMKLLFSDDPPANIKNNHPQAYEDFKSMMRDADILLVRSPLTGNMVFSRNISKKGRRWKNLLKIVANDLKQEEQKTRRRRRTRGRVT